MTAEKNDDRLAKARKAIDETDAEIAKLFETRFHAVRDVADYKIDHDLPVFDATREKSVIAANTALIQDEELRPYFAEMYVNLLALSRKYQTKIKEEKE